MAKLKYLKRNEFLTEQPSNYEVRGYWVKLIEDDDPDILQNKINAFLLLLPTLVAPRIALQSCDVRTYGNGNKLKHSATLTFYYIGDATIDLP